MTSSTSKPGESAEDTPLDPSIAVDLKGKFSVMHQIVLPDSMLLVPTLQNKIYWDIVKSQPVITPLLLESIRTMSSSDRPTAQVLKYTPGKAIVGAEVIIDAVDGYGEVYERTEAWFYTVAFCSAANPAFFDMQSALMCSKKIWQLLGMTFGSGQRPPVEFYVGAWAQTVHHFSEQMRLTSASELKPIVMAFASWERFWINFIPSSGSSSSAPVGGNTRVDTSSKLQDEVSRLRTRASELQSQRDRAESRAARGTDVLDDRPRPKWTANPFKPGGNKNKGGNKGQGKDKNKDKNKGGDRPNPGNAGYKRREPEALEDRRPLRRR